MRRFTAEDFDNKTNFFDQMAASSWFIRLQDETCRNLSGEELLDSGCGTGRLAARLRQFQHRVGIDLSSEMIREAKQLHHGESGLTFLQADVEKLPFPDEQFDAVISTCVLFLLPEPDRALSEWFRVQRRGGELRLLNPAPGFSSARAEQDALQLPDKERNGLLQWGRIAERRHRFSEAELERKLTAAGYQEVEVRLSACKRATIAAAIK
ncbi:class I SAM-dependent methyltransferase [Alkalicoccus luteus]|uniref:Class I SAM-dependent methyltransferase n=1 Tax=Alkalicoccus luteus TaxID=1237094 RepID=A0A969PN25_9BACI|nr:class I SAM-dependent methyltransferase [Alkalicoccus luteus]NJP36420.1 class I SAM-dependent methyltransferase [Alkalicoccus luteus]